MARGIKFDKKLLKLVEKHALIYLWRNSSVLRDINQCWDRIAAAMRSNPNYCKQRWKAIRSYYLRLKREDKKPTHYFRAIAANGVISFLDEITNVDQTSQPISTCPACKNYRKFNVLKKSNNSITVGTTSINSNNTVQKPVKTGTATIASNVMSLNSGNESLPRTSQESVEVNLVAHDKIPGLTQSKSQEESVVVSLDKVDDEEYTMRKEKRIIINKNLEQTTIDNFDNSTNNKTADIYEITALKQEDSDDCDFLNIPNHEEGTTETFFHHMGEYVATEFPNEKQMEIRLEICSLVTNTELEMLQNEMT